MNCFPIALSCSTCTLYYLKSVHFKHAYSHTIFSTTFQFQALFLNMDTDTVKNCVVCISMQR